MWNAPTVHLPQHSPDFNPQGQLFGELRKPLNGRFYEDPGKAERDITERLEGTKGVKPGDFPLPDTK